MVAPDCIQLPCAAPRARGSATWTSTPRSTSLEAISAAQSAPSDVLVTCRTRMVTNDYEDSAPHHSGSQTLARRFVVPPTALCSPLCSHRIVDAARRERNRGSHGPPRDCGETSSPFSGDFAELPVFLSLVQPRRRPGQARLSGGVRGCRQLQIRYMAEPVPWPR